MEIEGITRAAFHEASGFDSSIDVIEHREGGGEHYQRETTGTRQYSNITLKRGITDDHEACTTGIFKASKVTSVDAAGPSSCWIARGSAKVRWNFFEAWPRKWTGPSLNSEGNDVAIETLELAHERIERQPWPCFGPNTNSRCPWDFSMRTGICIAKA